MTIEALATKLGPLDEMRSSPAARRFTLAVWRAFRDTGAPLDQAALDALATTASLDPSDAKVLIERYAELDNDGDVIGLSGLSVGDHPHSIEIGDTKLSAWCAWDPFFLVPILGGSAIVGSVDPHTGAPVRLTFEDGRVTQASPSDTVISIVVPEPQGENSRGSTVEDLWANF